MSTPCLPHWTGPLRIGSVVEYSYETETIQNVDVYNERISTSTKCAIHAQLCPLEHVRMAQKWDVQIRPREQATLDLRGPVKPHGRHCGNVEQSAPHSIQYSALAYF